MTDSERLSWQNRGACLNLDVNQFYPERGGSAKKAKMHCNGNTDARKGTVRLPCPVREQCLRYALENREAYGIWGGVSERQRRGMAARLGVEVRPRLKVAS